MCFVLVSSGMIFSTPRLSSLFRGFAFVHSCVTVQLSRMQDLSSHSLFTWMSVRSIARTNVFDFCYWTKHLKPSSLHPNLFFFFMMIRLTQLEQSFKHQPGTVSRCPTWGLIGRMNLEFWICNIPRKGLAFLQISLNISANWISGTPTPRCGRVSS